jgi:hypothetical protein
MKCPEGSMVEGFPQEEKNMKNGLLSSRLRVLAVAFAAASFALAGCDGTASSSSSGGSTEASASVSAAAYVLTFTPDSHSHFAAVSGSLPTTVGSGGSVSFKVTFDEGYGLTSVSVGTAKLTAVDGVYTVSDIVSDVTIYAYSHLLAVSSLSYEGTPTAAVQYDGEILNTSGLTFTATYDDESQAVIAAAELILPTLAVGADIVVSCGDADVTITGITIEYKLVFSLSGVATFKASAFVPGGYLSDGVTLPTAEDLAIDYGEGTDAFQGWYFDAACTEDAVFTTETSGNKTLYAKWDNFGDLSVSIGLAESGAPTLTVTGTVLAVASSAAVSLWVGTDEATTEIGEDYALASTYDLTRLAEKGKWYDLHLYYSSSNYIDLVSDEADLTTEVAFNGVVYLFQVWSGTLKVEYEDAPSINYVVSSVSFALDGTTAYLVIDGTYSGTNVTASDLSLSLDGVTSVAAGTEGDASGAFEIRYDLSGMSTGTDYYLKILSLGADAVDLPFSSMVNAGLINGSLAYGAKRWDSYGSGLIVYAVSTVSSDVVSLIADDAGKPMLQGSDATYLDVSYSEGWQSFSSNTGALDLSNMAVASGGTAYVHFGNSSTNLTTVNAVSFAKVTYNNFVYSFQIGSWQDMVVTIAAA